MTVRVVLVDDQPLIRSALRILIVDSGDLTTVGEAGTGDEAVAVVSQTRPDVVVMDIRMPGMDGIEATRRVMAGPDAPRVLILTTFDDDEYVYAALRAGASGFLVKDTGLDEILSAIRVIAAGEGLMAPRATRLLIEQFVRGPQSAPPPVPSRSADIITEREREVLTLIGQGKANSEIASELWISVATAKAHVGRLLTKLDARDRVQLVIIAYEMGLVSTSR
ncbi:two component transcriptional regulator, LuxR family [Micromonospora matsumotoense]|uniref:Two component transcriptional regulator, LuxR family n=1 Tax=Micromonospora matsumotoense TaxID=121616 RepID=A0A1C5AV59_9ACTN|nr:response regulator transcription factor [Micromonospora matsumotoense]SCF49109.1 two component transcriptional regulator, LuxR family [Micromonospora matsumotoense]